MGPLKQTLLASLLTGSTLGPPVMAELADPEGIDALARAFADDPHTLQAGLDARVELLQTIADPTAVWTALPAETLVVAAPLADRMGLAHHRAQLEDEAFRLLEPGAWAQLTGDIGTNPAADMGRVQALSEVVEGMLESIGVAGVVTGRVKSRYSVHRKMRRKGLPVEAITDRLGLRVCVETVDECYGVMGALRRAFIEVPGSFDDYILRPKPNGYRSLHAALVAPGGVEPVEIQVRTHGMHAFAEEGAAAHWRYKMGGVGRPGVDLLHRPDPVQRSVQPAWSV